MEIFKATQIRHLIISKDKSQIYAANKQNYEKIRVIHNRLGRLREIAIYDNELPLLEMLRECPDYIDNKEDIIKNIDSILDYISAKVCQFLEIDNALLKQKKRQRTLVDARFIAIAISCETINHDSLGKSELYKQIGRYYNVSRCDIYHGIKLTKETINKKFKTVKANAFC